MDKLEKEASLLVKSAYVKQGLQNMQSRQQLLSILMTHRKMPLRGWNEQTVEFLLNELAVMDSNNFMNNVGVGEREGRVFSNIVARRHYGMSHGVGRSGDIAEVQPKAAGSSLAYKLALGLVQHALQCAGLNLKGCVLLPLATGMSLTMTFLTLRQRNPTSKYIIWSRIDQKSCFKSIMTAGCEPVIVQLVPCVDGSGALETNCAEIERLLQLHGKDVLCVLTTTSCFAPRQPDSVDVVARLCAAADTPHVINNAYGIQCPVLTKLVMRATVVGRVDYVVQSTDKNFMVPVGGSIVLSPDADRIKHLSATYPGRASMSPILDLLVTLLSMGEQGWRGLLAQRVEVNSYLVQRLSEVAAIHGEELLLSPRNCISTAVTLKKLDKLKNVDKDVSEDCDAGSDVTLKEAKSKQGNKERGPTFLGSMLFQRGVSGCRVIAKEGKVSKVEGHSFTDWGSNCDDVPCSYFTAACAVGATLDEIDTFILRLSKVLSKLTPV
jgi:O-phospho-L-seryl-tRNASec:L-selenocysteinyl-tRNA synthase